MPDSRIHPNGIDGRTGKPVLPPMTREEFADRVLGRMRTVPKSAVPRPDTDPRFAFLRAAATRAAAVRSMSAAAVPASVAPSDGRELERQGWGVIFGSNCDPQVIAALQPLLAHRRTQATVEQAARYREFVGPAGLQPGESKRDFLDRHDVEPGPTNPGQLPYYLLLVGGPDEIPFRFQEQMRSRHAVGRLHLDTPADYARYAATVVALETGARARPQGALFCGTDHDELTHLSAEQMVKPLLDFTIRMQPQREITDLLGLAANRDAMVAHLCTKTPALWFAAGHGLQYAYPGNDAEQRARQGALVCPSAAGAQLAANGETLAAADFAVDADVSGMIAFLFACFGAGTPDLDDFAGSQLNSTTRTRIAAAPFTAALPRRLLAAGAQAMVAHVDRAWEYSFADLQCHRRFLRQLFGGQPVGLAMDPFSCRYLDLGADLGVMLEDLRFGTEISNVDLADAFVVCGDARNLVLLGDPACRAVQPP